MHACVAGVRREATPYGRAWQRCPGTLSWFSSTTPHVRSSPTRWSSECSRRCRKAGTAWFRGFRSGTRSSGSARTAAWRRPSSAIRSGRCRRLRPSQPTDSDRPLQVTVCYKRPIAPGLVEAVGGRVKVVEGDPRLLKVTSAADLETVAGWRLSVVVFDVGETLVDEASRVRPLGDGGRHHVRVRGARPARGRAAVSRRVARARPAARRGGEHASPSRGLPSAARRFRRILRALGRREAGSLAFSTRSSQPRKRRPGRSSMSATGSTTTSCLRSPRGYGLSAFGAARTQRSPRPTARSRSSLSWSFPR